MEIMETTTLEDYKLPVIETLDDLVRELDKAFSTDRVNTEYVGDLMLSYKSNPKEWRKFAKFDPHRYTRNLVDDRNGRFNLMVLAWSEGQGSSIHDHANAHCFMKMLSGSLKEVRFDWPGASDDETTPMKVIGETVLNINDVAYINDSLGLHRVENRSHSEPAVSLHLYCPPFNECQMFDQRTGHKTKCKVTFWSKFGERTPYVLPNEPENN